ncbi:unnamed protein product [Closterium sp. NIES-64]|nr:unnamed protein product [Closterium sp. NIES-64]
MARCPSAARIISARHVMAASERERLQTASAPGTLAHTSAAPGSAWLLLLAAARLLLLAAHYCYSWLRTAFSFRPSCNWYTSTWRLLLLLARSPHHDGRRQRQLVTHGCSS